MSNAVPVGPTYFVIDVDQLKIKSRKPHHLEARLQSLNHKKYTMEQHRIAHQSRFHRRAEILESRKQSCSQRISKAKRVAQNHSKRSQEKGSDLDLHHQNIDSKLVPSKDLDSESYIDSLHLDAAQIIQTWWRIQKVTKVTQLYKKMGLSLESSRKMPFSKLSKLIQSDAMARAVGRMLVRAKRTSTEPVANWKNPARIFLSSYVVLSHPQEVFANVGPEEEDLQEYALQMLMDFEDWMDVSHTFKVLLQGRKFLSSWVMLYEAFDNWKSGNQEKIAKDLIKHFMELEKLWLSVRNQQDAEEEWMENIARQQKQVFSRLNRFGTHYMNDLFAARKAAYDGFLANEENDVSSCKAMTMLNTSVDVYPIAIRSRRDSVTRSLPDSESSKIVKQVENQVGLESEDTFKSIWSNQKLAHELILDPEFRMKRNDSTSLEGQVAEISKKVFFENIKFEFDAGNYKQSIGLIGDIREV